MMLARLIFYFIGNIGALLILKNLVPNFEFVDYPIVNLFTVALLFTAINNIIRPAVKYLFTTFVIISLGLFSIIINATMLYLLDFLTENITINGLDSLIIGAIIISLFNIIIAGFGRLLFWRHFY